MKAPLALAAVLFACVGFSPVILPAPATAPMTTKIVGDYVEARTASVFAGACHYNGELVTTGNDAVMAWNISSGVWKGADLSGIRVMAALDSDHNLGDASGNRKSELVIDASATDAQVAAVTDMLRTECGTQLGSIVSVRRAPISFTDKDHSYSVKSDGFASLAIDPMPNDECCKQPSLVWYSPLAPIDHRKVGYTTLATYTAARVGDPWQRGDENSAFYGSFTF